MEFEQQGIPDIETEWERVSIIVRNAYQAWFQDPTNPELVRSMNYALDEAYGTGVRIAVKVTEGTLESSDLINPELDFKKLGVELESEIIIGSIREIAPKRFKGQAVIKDDTSYLSLDLHLTRLGYSIPFALIKPKEIVSFTPIEPAD